jgi:hypothetical protein
MKVVPRGFAAWAARALIATLSIRADHRCNGCIVITVPFVFESGERATSQVGLSHCHLRARLKGHSRAQLRQVTTRHSLHRLPRFPTTKRSKGYRMGVGFPWPGSAVLRHRAAGLAQHYTNRRRRMVDLTRLLDRTGAIYAQGGVGESLHRHGHEEGPTFRHGRIEIDAGHFNFRMRILVGSAEQPQAAGLFARLS